MKWKQKAIDGDIFLPKIHLQDLLLVLAVLRHTDYYSIIFRDLYT